MPEISIDEEMDEMERKLESFCQKGSDWRLEKIIQLSWCQVAFHSIPRRVGHHRGFKLPCGLRNKKAVVNVTNAPADECFK